MPDSYIDSLKKSWKAQKFLCVGLDPDLPVLCPEVDFSRRITPDDPRIPSIISRIRDWARGIYQATSPFAASYKPNLGFFLRAGVAGMMALACVIEDAPLGIPVILDGKFNDIGNTGKAYADGAFIQFGAAAVTANPYLGIGALMPFFDRTERFVFVLAKTSNQESGEFQDRPTDESDYLFELVASSVEQASNRMMGGFGLVAGATYPKHIELVRKAAPTVPLLIPGVGKQGGDLAAAVRAARTGQGGFILNVSSAIGSAKDPGAVANDYHEQLVAAFYS